MRFRQLPALAAVVAGALFSPKASAAQQAPVKPWSHITPAASYTNTKADPLSYIANAIAGETASVDQKHRVAQIIQADNPAAFYDDNQYVVKGKTIRKGGVDGLGDKVVAGATLNLSRALEYVAAKPVVATQAAPVMAPSPSSILAPVVSSPSMSEAVTVYRAPQKSLQTIDSLVAPVAVPQKTVGSGTPEPQYRNIYSRDSSQYVGAARQKVTEKKARLDSLVDMLNTHAHDTTDKKTVQNLADTLGVSRKTVETYLKNDVKHAGHVMTDSAAAGDTTHADSSHANHMPAPEPVRTYGRSTLGGMGALTLSSRSGMPLPMGQAFATTEIYSPPLSSTVVKAKLGVSLRPLETAEGKQDLAVVVTTANMEWLHESMLAQFGIPDLQIVNSAYNTIGRFPCGCSLNTVQDKAASMAGLYMQQRLLETNGLGFAMKWSNHRAAATAGAVSVLQSDFFKQGDNVLYLNGYIDTDTKANLGTRFLGSVSGSESSTAAGIGVHQWLGEKLQLRLSASTLADGDKKTMTDVFLLYYPNRANTLSFGSSRGSYDGDRAPQHDAFNWTHSSHGWQTNFRIELEREIQKNLKLYFGIGKKF